MDDLKCVASKPAWKCRIMPNVYDPDQLGGISAPSSGSGAPTYVSSPGSNVSLEIELEDLSDVNVTGNSYTYLYKKPDGSFGFRPTGYGTILGTYPDEASLEAAHPTGTSEGSYIVGSDLYIWTTEWTNVGPFVGPQGPAGADGTSVSIKGSDTWANISALTNQELGDLWLLSADEAGIGFSGDGLMWSGTVWSNIGPLRGPAGPQGPQGVQGVQGIQGEIGFTGPPGAIGATGAKGDQGDQGIPGQDGSKIYSGTGIPAPGLGANIDFYINDSNGDLYSKSGGSWVVVDNITGPQGIQGVQGVKGDQGDQGLPGAQGDPGTGGSVWHSGVGAPNTGDFNITDWYLDTSSGDVYEKTGVSAWTLRDNITGPQGIQGAPGEQGDPGPAGADGADGSVWYSGAGAPSDALGQNGDYYLNDSNGDVYTKLAGTWGAAIDNLTGPQGPAGQDGADGDTGPAGADGKTVLSGSGAPGAGLGTNGDFYIDTTADAIYGPKTAGDWGTPTSIIGPAGADGATGSPGAAGADGADGSKWYSGAGDPTALGLVGDYYLKTNGNYYVKTDDDPEVSAYIGTLIGPQGPAGTAGSNGSDGADGNTVLHGVVDPTTEGVDGDFYINTVSNYIFGPKATTWPTGVSLVGPEGPPGTGGSGTISSDTPPASPDPMTQWFDTDTGALYLFYDNTWVGISGVLGPEGPTGAAGTDGKTILYGAVNPTSEGTDGDFYINTATNYIFGPKSGTWPSGTSLVGPTGPTGPQGEIGQSSLDVIVSASEPSAPTVIPGVTWIWLEPL
jgi:hypothetical protein